VIDVSNVELDSIILYSLKQDLEDFQTHPILRGKRANQSWQLIFNPKEAEKGIQNDKLEDHSLEESALKAAGVKVTIQRRKIRTLALEAE
jgi:hypothetical protein